MPPSRRSDVPPFEVMDVLARVAALRAQGREVISLCAGEPGQGAPTAVQHAAARLHAGRDPLGYSPALGEEPLREAIARHYARWYGLPVDPGEVAVTTGSSGGFLLTLLAAFDPGDRVALARPGYPAYRTILASLGCEVVDLDCGPRARHQPSVELLAAAHAQRPLAGLVLASPANPTGTMLGRAELARILRWCAEERIRVVSDEIYHGITYPASGAADPKGVCAWELDRSTVVVSSLSKYWGMTGWRLGWALLPEDLRRPVDALAGNLALCPPVPAQRAGVAAFEPESYAEGEAAVAGYAAARELLLAAAPDLGWGPAAPADGAFYYWADLGPQLRRWGDSRSWCAALLEEAGVALTPGIDFDPADGGRRVRVSFAAGPEVVAVALERILTWQAGR